MKTYEMKAAELLKVFGFDGLANEILNGKQTALKTYQFLTSINLMRTLSHEKQAILKTALYALERESTKEVA